MYRVCMTWQVHGGGLQVFSIKWNLLPSHPNTILHRFRTTYRVCVSKCTYLWYTNNRSIHHRPIGIIKPFDVGSDWSKPTCCYCGILIWLCCNCSCSRLYVCLCYINCHKIVTLEFVHVKSIHMHSDHRIPIVMCSIEVVVVAMFIKWQIRLDVKGRYLCYTERKNDHISDQVICSTRRFGSTSTVW